MTNEMADSADEMTALGADLRAFQHAAVPASGFVTEAAGFDAQGRHDEAINVLARGTKQGDLAAMTLLGKRLLTGDRAPPMAKEGISFLVDAANAGGGEAANRLAVLLALGYGVPQSWSNALDALTVAAERGYRPAQGQLFCLARDRELAAQALNPNPSQSLWRGLAGTVSVSFWTQTPPGMNILSESPVVTHITGFAPPPVCQWLIELARDRLAPAMVYDSAAQEVVRHQTRTNTAAIFDMMSTDLLNVLLQARISAAVKIPIRQFEAATVLHYSVGEEITPHFDFIDPDSADYENQIRTAGQRAITFLVYLNEEYEGGQTGFPKLSVEVQGKRGEALFFINALPDGSPDLRTEHIGAPPRSGEKWIVTQFIRNRPVFAAAV
ncbi:MAG: 2OG-Fe(II) oxygenase [Gammaproteobacteria bacterium]|nr:2OG-Fe(II) oxygenase [Gammaproteobacteria bacterium]